MPAIPILWALGLFTSGIVVGGFSFSNLSNKLLLVGVVGAGVYAYTKAK